MRACAPAIALLFILAQGLAAQAEDPTRILARSLADGEKALKERKFDDARLWFKAALNLEPANQQALAGLADTLAGLKKNDEALAAALTCFDAPKADARIAPAQTARSLKQVRGQSAHLAAFLDLRTRIVADVLKIRPRATKEKRDHDADWLLHLSSQVAPADMALVDLGQGKTLAPGRPHALHGAFGGAAPATVADTPSTGFRDISALALWRQGSDKRTARHDNGEFIFAIPDRESYTELILMEPGYEIAGDYCLKFEVMYKALPDKAPRFSAAVQKPPRGAEGYSVMFFPHGNADAVCADTEKRRPFVSVASQTEGQPWTAIAADDSPKDFWKPGTWYAVTVNWDEAATKMTVDVGGKRMYDNKLKDIAMKGWVVIAAYVVEEVRFRKLQLKNK